LTDWPQLTTSLHANSHSFPSPSHQSEELLYFACDGREVAAVMTCHTLSRTQPVWQPQSHHTPM